MRVSYILNTCTVFFPHSLCMSSYGYIYFDVCFLFVKMMGAAIFDIFSSSFAHRAHSVRTDGRTQADNIFQIHTLTYTHTHAHFHTYQRNHPSSNVSVEEALQHFHMHTNTHTRALCAWWCCGANLPYDSLNVCVDTKTTVVRIECEPKWNEMK